MSEMYAKLCHDQAHLTLRDALHQRVMIILLNPFLQLQHVLAIGESNDTEVNANEKENKLSEKCEKHEEKSAHFPVQTALALSNYFR